MEDGAAVVKDRQTRPARLARLCSGYGLAAWLVACSLAAGNASAAPPSTAYKLVLADTFDEPKLDTMKWGTNYPWGRQHNHQGYMTEERIVITDGVLDLEAKTGRHPNATDFWRDDFGWQQVNYTTGAIHTSGKLGITRGYIEASVKLYGSLGSWPAIWMLGNGWPPEIDLMEFPRGTAGGISNTNNTAMFNYHYTNSAGSNASYYRRDTALPSLTDGFHTFALEWTSSVMNFYVDGSLKHAVTDAAAIADASNMYLLLNQGVGGWAGDVTGDFESHFWIDSVKVWQIPGAGTDSTWKTTAGSGGWDTSGNWSAGVPKYEDAIARFGSNDNAAVAATWSNSRTVGGLHFDTTTTAYTLGSRSGSLQVAKATSGANASIYMTQATNKQQTVASRLELYDGVTITTNSPTADLLVSGTVIGPGRIDKAGPGVLVLSASNTFRGGLQSLSGGSLGDLGTIRLTNSHAAGTGTVALPASNASSIVVELQGDIDVPNDLTTAGRSNFTFLRNALGSNTWSGDITITGLGGGYAIDAAAGTLRLAGRLTTALANASNRVVRLIGSGSGVVTGDVRDGGTTKVGLAKDGPGTWILSGTGSGFSAGTTVTQGRLVATTGAALGTGPVAVEGGILRIERDAVVTSLSITGGRLELASDASVAVDVAALTLDGTATGSIDLGRGRMTIRGGAATQTNLRAAVVSGRGDGSWAGSTGIMSAAVAADLLAGVPRSLGWVENGDGTLSIAYAAPGDTNLDDAVDILDAANFMAGGLFDSGLPGSWNQGDFGYDGIVDILDAAEFMAAGLFDAGSYGHADSVGRPVAAVPEPTAGVSLAIAGFATAATRCLRRWRPAR
jgi:autotransporter-associated beta strand protein